MHVNRLGWIALLVGLGATWAQCAAPVLKAQVPMRDGTKLVTDVYLPGEPASGAWPVILARSTYGRIGGPVDAILAQGLGVVVQDVRGMGASEGEKFV